MGFYGYQGWGDAEANANFKATGGAGKGGPSSLAGVKTPEQIAQDIINSQSEAIKKETSYLEKYQTENPFVFDEVFARESSKAEYEPYYQRLLQDYLSGVNLEKESVQAERGLLQDLYELDTTKRSNLFDRAIQSAEEGSAGRGMFFSGVSRRDVGEKTVDYLGEQKGVEEKFGYGMGALERKEKGIGLEEATTTRGMGEEEQYAIEGGILKRKGEAQTKYYTPLVQSYLRQFPTESNVLGGYVPPEFLRY